MSFKSTVIFLVVLACGIVGCQRGEEAKEAPAAAEATVTASQSVYSEKLEQFKKVDMEMDFSGLSPSEREVLHKLGMVATIMDKLYLKQVYAGNSEIRSQIEASQDPNRAELLELFDLHFGPWDTLDANKPFFGDTERPEGAGVYPVDMTRDEFNTWIAEHPEDEAAFKSLYTVILREGEGLKAIPYSVFYKEEVDAMANLMEEAAEISENESLKTFLNMRAKAFRTDDYRDSEMAWMDLDGAIEVALGPYEVYTDALFGQKAFFEIFLTIKNPEESAKLDKYKSYLGALEKNLAIPDAHKNMNRGSESPLAVVDQVAGGGDCKPGVQTIAFNLPNDEVVREKKGSKKVMLKNVMKAKYDAILDPMADFILAEEQRPLLDFEYFFLEVLFHEMSHGLGPGSITVDGRATTVGEELKETYSKIEEGKADVMGVYNLFFMMEKGELPKADRDKLLATYFAGLFRSMRFGVHEAHGAGAAFQYNFLKERQAFKMDPSTKLFTIDLDKMAEVVPELVTKVCMIQAVGDYEGAKDFLATYAVQPLEVKTVVERMNHVPVDIKPIYPEL